MDIAVNVSPTLAIPEMFANSTSTTNVSGNTAFITPELALLVAVAPVTLKKFVGMPSNVNPGFGINIIVAV